MIDMEQLELSSRILATAPESWDGEDAGASIAVTYVQELEQRVLALGGSLERYPEDGDGATLPDVWADPAGYAGATIKDRLAVAFTEWERKWREEPDSYMNEQERLAETEETLGDLRAAYLIKLLNEAS